MNRRRLILLFALALASAAVVFCGLGWWLTRVPRDPLFHGKPETEWIKGVAYGMTLSDAQNQEQIKCWRAFGFGGLGVLARGLDAGRPARTYRKIYRRVAPKLPSALVRLLPAPLEDKTKGLRMNVLDLLSRMGKDARPAWPAVARALAEGDADVGQIAIAFFAFPEDDQAFLNQMPARDKKKLLPLFIRALQDGGSDWGLRVNAALALKYYPEHASQAAPALAKALQDAAPTVRLQAADALHRVDADAAQKAGAVAVLAQLLRNPDVQVAGRAAFALRQFQNEGEIAVPALIEALQNTNDVGCNAVWSLQWAFPKHADLIIPALRKTAERNDYVGRYARAAVKHLESNLPAK